MILIDRYGESAAAALGALSDDTYVVRLERRLAEYFGKPATAVSSVDAAVHTALHLCGVARGDYVFVPTFTFYSYISAVANMGGVPVFLDCDPLTRCVSAAALDAAMLWAELQDKPPKAVVIDNAFGSVADYDVLSPLCKAYGVATVELAVGGGYCGEYNGTPCGANADVGVIGFDHRLHGGGAAVLCDEKDAAQKFTRAVFSEGENYDYKQNNVVAALNSASLDVSEKIARRARKNLDALCSTHENIVKPVRGDSGRYALCKPACGAKALRDAGFVVKHPPCVHTLERYADCEYFEHEPGYSACLSFADKCLIDMDFGVLARNKLSRMIKE